MVTPKIKINFRRLVFPVRRLSTGHSNNVFWETVAQYLNKAALFIATFTFGMK